MIEVSKAVQFQDNKETDGTTYKELNVNFSPLAAMLRT